MGWTEEDDYENRETKYDFPPDDDENMSDSEYYNKYEREYGD